jgi:integrase
MLTDTACTNAHKHPKTVTGKAFKLSDSGGLYLLIEPRKNNRWAKGWRVKYRIDGTEKLLSLGTYPDISLRDAREQRDIIRKQVADGIDPSLNRKVQKTGSLENSFKAIALEWFAKHMATKSESHQKRTLRRLERDLFPWVGSRPISSIKASELLISLQRVESRGAIETAHRVLGICGQVFQYAEATGRADRDISQALRGSLTPVNGKHFASMTEPHQVGELLRAIDSYQGSIVVKSALRLAPLVFVRPGELRSMEWQHVDLEAREWRYVVTKTKTPHIVPLSSQSIEILKEIKPLTGDGRYVFPNGRTPNGSRPLSDAGLLVALRSMGISKDEMTIHGFRAMARTILDEVLGFRPDFIEHQLAHAVKDPNGRAYNRTAHLAERGVMMQAWADYLDGLKSPKIC